jgi:hypothetical protein
MKLFLLPASLLLCALGCTSSLPSLRTQHSVTAMLNDSVWYGQATAADATALNDSACANGQILLFFASNVGYIGDRLRLPPDVLARQAGEFIPRQRLTLYNVPARKGKYALKALNQCGGVVLRQGNFALLGNGSALIEAYFLKANKPNWVRISRIDSTARSITGRFKATLVDTTGRVAQFRHGRFQAKMPNLRQKAQVRITEE